MCFSVTHFFQKVKRKFNFGHLFLSIFENPKKVLKKTLEFEVLDHNALIFSFLSFFFVTIIFLYFLSKSLATFLLAYFRQMETNYFSPNSIDYKYSCNICDYNSHKINDYKKHLLTLKHLRLTETNKKSPENLLVEPIHKCFCGKIYNHKSSLCKHKKECKVINEEATMEYLKKEITPEIIIELIQQNKELQQTLIDQNKCMMEIIKNGTHNTINSNNNNKTFNLQVFLNETCKDAINLTDFVNQLQVSVNDLEETGKLGYAEGISKVFIKNLNDIDYNMRPIHCSDLKRETLYIKEDNQWNKDDQQKSNLTKAIKQVANKNIKNISEWQKLHPDYCDPDSKQNDKYMKIVLNSMSGSTKEESEKNYEKIAKNIVKEVVIEKT